MFHMNNIRNAIIHTLAVICMILCVYFIGEGFRISKWTYAIFTFQLFLVTLIIQFVFWLIRKLEITRYLVNILVEYIATVFIVLGLGFLFNWYDKDTIWIVFLNLTVVFIITYALGLLQIRNDVKEINELLILRTKSPISKDREDCYEKFF